jgi:hypothetical protein
MGAHFCPQGFGDSTTERMNIITTMLPNRMVDTKRNFFFFPTRGNRKEQKGAMHH